MPRTAGRVPCPLPTNLRTATPITTENQEPGTTSWFVAAPDQDGIAGYAARVSYTPGQTVSLFVDSRTDPFTYTVYRMGDYAGLGGRQVLRDHVAANLPQPQPTVSDDHNKGAKLLLTHWHKSASFAVPAEWASGFYLIKLVDDRSGAASYATFTLRSLTPAPVVVVVSTSTWQAYNTWGGLSLYRDLRAVGRDRTDQRTVAHIVSFRRPYAQGAGAGDYFRVTRPLVSYLESRGYPVSYATDDDVRSGRAVGPDTRLVILDSHSEYHSMGEVNQLKAWQNRGVDIGLFGGNDFVWQTRFDNHAHTMAVWRFKRLDPVSHGMGATVRFESVGWKQNQLSGAMQVWGGGDVRQRAYAAQSWPWRRAGVAAGTKLGDVQGSEYDGMVLNAFTSTRELVLSRSVLAHPGRPTHPAQEMTLISPRGKGWVFSAGQNGFTWFLDYPATTPPAWVAPTASKYPRRSQVSQPVRRLVGNLIEKATGYRNPEPAVRAPGRVTPALRILAPANRQPVMAAPGRAGVMWADAPTGTNRINIKYGRRVVGHATANADTWVGGPVKLHGWHVITVTATDAAGRVLARSRVRVNMRAPSESVFHPMGLQRLWNDDDIPEPPSEAAGRTTEVRRPGKRHHAVSFRALAPGPGPCYDVRRMS